MTKEQRTYSGKSTVSLIRGAKRTGQPYTKEGNWINLLPYTQN